MYDFIPAIAHFDKFIKCIISMEKPFHLKKAEEEILKTYQSYHGGQEISRTLWVQTLIQLTPESVTK